ncbi:hypothetical protein V8D89_006238 [Ganoderma adspersum]
MPLPGDMSWAKLLFHLLRQVSDYNEREKEMCVAYHCSEALSWAGWAGFRISVQAALREDAHGHGKRRRNVGTSASGLV